jgi:CRISPR-associated protein Csh2
MAVSHNSDFLFLFEASLCNPNGDPDQENKPRMDYDTDTNLVTDVRIKRYIRDFLKENGEEIFVDLESDTKVKMDDKLAAVLGRIWDNDDEMKKVLGTDELLKKYLGKVKGKDAVTTVKNIINDTPADKEVNKALLNGLVANKLLDIRMFGSAFAIKGFDRSITGPIQMNWGYSLNKVYLLDSDTIASVMNDGNSTFGKDYRVKYSLLAIHGTINKAAAATTGLTDQDLEKFRTALWSSISANPTRSKLNQYPKLYVELVYNDGYYNGQFGDLRNLVNAEPLVEGKDREVKFYNDLKVDFSKLEALLGAEKGAGKPIHEVKIKTSADIKIKS